MQDVVSHYNIKGIRQQLLLETEGQGRKKVKTDQRPPRRRSTTYITISFTPRFSNSRTPTQVQGRLLLDIVIRKRPAILKLLSSEDKPLLVWGDTLLILDLRLDIVDGIRRLNLESNRLAGQSLDKDLHPTTETEDEMES